MNKAQHTLLNIAISLWLGCSGAAWAAGNVDTANGEVSAIGKDGKPHGLAKGDRVVEGETLITGRDGELLIKTDDSGVLAVRPSSRLVIDAYRVNGDSKDSVVLKLLRGGLRSITGWISKTNNKNYRITTATATVGIRGTDHEVVIIEDGPNAGTWNQVTEGATTLATTAGLLEQAAGGANAAGRATATGQAPVAAAALPAVFVPRPSDTRVQELKKDAQDNKQQRLETRQQQVASAGGLSAQGNPKVSTQCTPDAPAQKAFDSMLRAYEQGDIAYFQRRLDPSMVGYSALIASLQATKNNQQQTRLQVLRRQMQCGADVAMVDFTWQQFALSSTDFKPLSSSGQSSVLISGLSGGAGGGWQVNGLVGDNPFQPVVVAGPKPGATPSPNGSPTPLPMPTSVPNTATHVGVATVATPSVSYGALLQNCTSQTFNGFLTAVPNEVLPLSTQPFMGPFSVPGVCNFNMPNPPDSWIVQACTVNVNINGRGSSSFQGSMSYSVSPVPKCQVTGNGTNTATAQISYATNTPGQSFSGAIAGNTVAAAVGINFVGSSNNIPGGPNGTYNVSSDLSNIAACNAFITFPPQTCTPQLSQLALRVDIVDDDFIGDPATSLGVRVQTSDGDVETVYFDREGPNKFSLLRIPIERNAAAVGKNNGKFELVEPSGGPTVKKTTLTFGYTDAVSPQGRNILRTATLDLAP
jgi:hypothetical protein